MSLAQATAALLLGGAVPASGTMAGDTWSLATARAVSQRYEGRLPCGADQICMKSRYSALFSQTRTWAGASLPARFRAEMVLHTSMAIRPRMVVLIRRNRAGAYFVEDEVFAKAGEPACLSTADWRGKFVPPPELVRTGALCVEEKAIRSRSRSR